LTFIGIFGRFWGSQIAKSCGIFCFCCPDVATGARKGGKKEGAFLAKNYWQKKSKKYPL